MASKINRIHFGKVLSNRDLLLYKLNSPKATVVAFYLETHHSSQNCLRLQVFNKQLEAFYRTKITIVALRNKRLMIYRSHRVKEWVDLYRSNPLRNLHPNRGAFGAKHNNKHLRSLF